MSLGELLPGAWKLAPLAVAEMEPGCRPENAKELGRQ